LLLLDEPTAGVDPRLRAEFWNHFRDLARGGAGLLISTHHMDEALLCDRLAILSDGRVLACGTPRELLDRGHTRVHIWRGAQESILETRENYAASLPQLLQPYGLDPSVTKLEIERDTLEQIVLRLIDEKPEDRNV
jgi:ABC-2 type transport system ATP-binding protein